MGCIYPHGSIFLSLQCSCFLFKKKKNVNVKVIFATFYCKLIYFCINIYLIEQVEVKIVDSTTADACVTC